MKRVDISLRRSWRGEREYRPRDECEVEGGRQTEVMTGYFSPASLLTPPVISNPTWTQRKSKASLDVPSEATLPNENLYYM